MDKISAFQGVGFVEFTSVNIGFEISFKLSISRCGCVLAVSVTCVFTACSCVISVLM